MARSPEKAHSIAATSAGHDKSTASWLDIHFTAAQDTYLEMLRAVGIRPAWRVMDAGCGSGRFLPFIADLVGAKGSIHAIDIAAEHIEKVGNTAQAGLFPCPVTCEVGNTTSLAHPDDSFDVVWCANVSEYLTDRELSESLVEFKRVVRPGGLVAIKEFDGRSMTFYPSDPWILMRFIAARYPNTPSIQGQYRAISTKSRMEAAGLTHVRQQTNLIEHAQPLGPATRTFLADVFSGWSALARNLELPNGDQQFWRQQEDPEAAAHIINQPDFFWREGAILAVGQVP